MLPSDAYVRITHYFGGVGCPTGAAVVYVVGPTASQPPSETAQVAHENFGTIIVPFLSTDANMHSTLAKEGPDETGGSALVSSPVYTGGSGSATGAPMASILIHKNTAAGGRRGRGRMFLPGIDEGLMEDGGNVTPATVTALQAAVVNWQAACNTDGIPLWLEHQPPTTWEISSSGQPRRVVAGAAPDPTIITSLSVASRLGTQRRRQRR